MQTTAEQAIRQQLGQRVRVRRDRLGLTQTQLAERAGKEQATISRIESGDYRAVTIALIIDLAFALDCHPSDLCEWFHGVMDIARREPGRSTSAVA